ncbi:hypothetical protein BpHYR1_049295 [Brachionus plicatilis]|uniref:Uncharacterized protein n=1 Tax=Brachionus plicatilis TaxID=10195 RepID=A0A3M7P5K3_BRAPC|nr:hypothetical protein BpHYR1_049295 [Brachionus plicatilis]
MIYCHDTMIEKGQMKTSVRYTRTCHYSRISNLSDISLKSSNYVRTNSITIELSKSIKID